MLCGLQSFTKLYAEMKWNFAKPSDLLVEIKDPETIETMIGDVTETFKNTTTAPNQELKVKLRQVPLTGSPTRTFHVNHVVCGYAILQPNFQTFVHFTKSKRISTCHSFSYSKQCYVKHYRFERCSFFRPMLTERENKQVPAEKFRNHPL